MTKWIMPHEIAAEEVLPTNQPSRWVLPHEVQEPTVEPTPEAKALAAEGPITRGLIGAGKRLTDVGLGAKQTAGMLRNLLPGESSTWPQEVSERLKSERGAREAIAADPAAQIGSGTAELATLLAAPSARVPVVAAQGAMLGGPLTPRENPNFGDMLTEGAKQGALTGVGALGTNAAITGIAKLRNAAKGRFSDPEAANRMRIFRQNDVPASLGDITQNPNVLAMEDMIQHIPFSGRKKFLEKQSDRLGEVVEGAPERIAGVTTAQTKEDVGTVIANSIKQKYAAAKDASGKLYDAVEQRVVAAGNPPVIPSNTASEVQSLLSKYPSVFAKLSDDPQTVSTLQTIATGVSPTKSPIIGANGQPILTPPKLTFSELRQLDSDLGSMIRQGRQLTARGEMNNKSFDQLVKIQKALRKDIEDWSTSIGDPTIAEGVREANKFFRETVMPFRKNQLVRKVVQDENYNPDDLAKSMFKLDSPYLSSQAKEFLTPEGVQAGRYYLMNQAKRRAMDDTLSSGYSPSKFLKGTELGESGPKLFSNDELSQLADLQEMISASRRAAGYKFNPPTGASLWGAVAGKVPVVPLAARGLNAVTTNPAAMKFILSNPKLHTGSGGLGRVSEELLRKSGATLGTDLPEDAEGYLKDAQ